MKKVAKTFDLQTHAKSLNPWLQSSALPGLLDALHPLVAVCLLLCAQLQRFLSIVAKNDQEVVLNQGRSVRESEVNTHTHKKKQHLSIQAGSILKITTPMLEIIYHSFKTRCLCRFSHFKTIKLITNKVVSSTSTAGSLPTCPLFITLSSATVGDTNADATLVTAR